MKCISCKGEWTPPPGKTVTECPFCKESLTQNKTPTTYDNAKDALRFIADTYGAEALLTKSLFSDIAPTLNDERELIKIFRDKGALEVLKGALNAPPSEKEIAIKRAAAKLPAFMDKEAIFSMLYDFAGALGWPISKPAPPQPTPTPIQTVHPQLQRQKSNVGIKITPKVGSIHKFAGIDWRVLDVQNGQALLLSEKIIEKRAYHPSFVGITWEKCELRNYLNNEFYNKLGAVKSAIADTRNSNPNNPWYGMSGGNATEDKVFLLSIEEVVRYFGDSGDLKSCKGWYYESGKNVLNNTGDKNKDWYINDQYNSARVAKDGEGKAYWWWLRSPGRGSSRSRGAAYVRPDGSVSVGGLNVDYDSGGVRPALWLNL
jgi:hypothetical protein